MNGSDSPPKKLRLTRRNITIPTVLFERTDSLFAKNGYDGLSDYVQSNLRRDTEGFSTGKEKPKWRTEISDVAYQMATDLVKKRGYRDVDELVADHIRREWDSRQSPPIDRVAQSAQDIQLLAQSRGESRKT